MRSYQDLKVWQKSMELVETIYKITRQLPKEESFGLVSQLRRAVVSIPSNIAEGAKRNSKAEYIQFLGISSGSVAEVETQLILVARLYPTLEKDINNISPVLEEIMKMLYSLILVLKRSDA